MKDRPTRGGQPHRHDGDKNLAFHSYTNCHYFRWDSQVCQRVAALSAPRQPPGKRPALLRCGAAPSIRPSGVGARRFHFRGLSVALLLTFASAACQRAPAVSPPASTARPGVTFNKDVAPILFEHCATCHRPANPNAGKSPDDQWCFAGAPFSLIEYRDAREHAQQIADATARRIMPPWLPERGAGTFANARGLRDDQIAILQRWADEGAVEGDRGRQAPAAEMAGRVAAGPARPGARRCRRPINSRPPARTSSAISSSRCR